MRFVSLLLMAVGASIAGVYISKNRSASLLRQDENKNTKTKPLKISDEQMDDRLDDSFPASDPPSWGPRDVLH
jgi:hypothetical protein